MKKTITAFIISLCLIVGLGTHSTAIEPSFKRLYNNETVLELYSLDYESRTYQRITEDHDIDEVFNTLSKYSPPSKIANDKLQKGYLIVTDEGKHTVYLSSKSKDKKTKNLYILSERLNNSYRRHIQWFSYMSTENIKSIEFEAAGEKGFTNKKYSKTYHITASITDSKNIETVSSFLKNIIVNPKEEIYFGEYPNPGSAPDNYYLKINFYNGIVYTCTGPFLSIKSSDMNEMIVYSEDQNSDQITDLRDIMMQLSESKLEVISG